MVCNAWRLFMQNGPWPVDCPHASFSERLIRAMNGPQTENVSVITVADKRRSCCAATLLRRLFVIERTPEDDSISESRDIGAARYSLSSYNRSYPGWCRVCEAGQAERLTDRLALTQTPPQCGVFFTILSH
jgi:hypothetical protein